MEKLGTSVSPAGREERAAAHQNHLAARSVPYPILAAKGETASTAQPQQNQEQPLHDHKTRSFPGSSKTALKPPRTHPAPEQALLEGLSPAQPEPSFTLAVWSREAVAARARGPPKPQHRSVMGRLCRDQTCRGSGIWEGSACSTLWGQWGHRGHSGSASAGQGMPELSGCGGSG